MQDFGHKTCPSGVLECWSNGVVVPPNTDAFAKTRKLSFSVIPAEAGIQEHRGVLDPGFRRGDGREAFCEAINTPVLQYSITPVLESSPYYKRVTYRDGKQKGVDAIEKTPMSRKDLS